MALNKKELDRIVDFVKAVKELPGNEEFIAALWVALGGDPTKREVSNPKLDDIYEYCIERVALNQATGIYANFPFPDIVPHLIKDYQRMESFRRRDNFEDFCIAAYQQIECITNAIYPRVANFSFLETIADQPAYALGTFKGRETVYDISRRNGASTQKISDFIATVDPKTNQPKAMDAVKMVIYFILGGAATMDWALFNHIYELYYYRCLNHRGGFQTEHQANVTTRVCAERYKYYLLFQGVLIAYVSGICKGYEKDVMSEIMAWSKRFKTEKEVTITSVMPSIFFAKDEEGVSYESNCKCPEGKKPGDSLKVQIETMKGKAMITQIFYE